MKDLMEKVFESLYNKDPEMLGKIIKDFDYDINSSEESNEEEDFEDFIERLEKNAKKNNIKMEDIASRIVNNYKLSEENIDEIITMIFEDSKRYTVDIIKGNMSKEKFRECFYEDVDEEDFRHLVNEEEQGILEKILSEFNFYHDERTEDEKTKEYGKLYIEQLIKDKNSKEAIEIAELFRMNSLIPDGNEVKNMLTIENLKDEIKKQAKKSLKKEVKKLNKEIKTLNEEMPEVRLRGGDDKNYCKFDERIKLINFDYEKEMNAVYVDTIDVMVGNKKILTLKEKKWD